MTERQSFFLMKYNIVWFIDGLGMGGAERLLVPFLRRLNESHFSIRVCAFQVKEGNPMGVQLRRLGVTVDLLPIPHLRAPTAIPRLVRYLGQHRAHLVHTQLEFANTLGTVAARLRRLPTVATLHTFDDVASPGKEARRIRLMWWVLRHGCRRIIAVSDGLRGYVEQTARLPSARCLTLYNGIDLTRFCRQPPAARLALRRAWGIPPRAPLAISVAVLREPKGIQYMLRALPHLLRSWPDLRYLVVGGGAHEGALRALAGELGVTERVIFAGIRHDIPDLLNMSDLFVHPTREDALPTVLMEAMAVGLPLVASRVGGVPEMVHEGENGLLVPAEDIPQLIAACHQILDNPALAQQMSTAGQQIAAAQFNIDRQAQKLAQIYHELLS
ncbi:MAG: glycosyltransferase family 4 protein [Anaerolineales bacterium]|nr:glycosyltransferase family 4 protein [Anaerolineales bacterium]